MLCCFIYFLFVVRWLNYSTLLHFSGRLCKQLELLGLSIISFLDFVDLRRFFIVNFKMDYCFVNLEFSKVDFYFVYFIDLMVEFCFTHLEVFRMDLYLKSLTNFKVNCLLMYFKNFKVNF